jgi:16S rRNA (cytidine1402-2'-O)-methyltransferase
MSNQTHMLTAKADIRTGTLYLVPTPLDFGCSSESLTPIEELLPKSTLLVAASISHWITENAKSTRGFLSRVNRATPLHCALQQQVIVELPREVHKKGDHVSSNGSRFDARPLMAQALDGKNMGLVSEAGMPAVADPGSSVVRAAHALGISVVPLVGPVSLMLALAASGLNGQNFAFVGYLPQDAAARMAKLKELDSLALKTGQTQIFIETPYRNTALLHAAMAALRPGTRLSVSCGLTLPTNAESEPPEGLRQFSATIDGWRRSKPALALSLPTVFLLGL